MRAIVQSGYGAPEDVLSLQDIGVPQVRPGTVLVRVLAASLHPDIWHVVNGVPQVLRLMGAGVHKPKQRVPGTDLAGFVVATGAGVTHFQPGEAVLGESVTRHQWQNGGAFAEYALVPESGLVLKPDNVTFEQAAAVPTSGIIALHSVGTAGRLSAGQRVLVNRAASGVGMFSVLLAEASGAQ